MPEDPKQFLDILVMALVFGMVLAVWLAGVILWMRQRTYRSRYIEKRLGFADPGLGDRRVLRLWKDGKESTTTVPNRRRPVFELIEDTCHRAGWDVPAASFVFSLLSLSTLVFAVVLVVTQNLLIAVGIIVAVLFCFQLWMKRRIALRLNLFETQLIDGLELAARSLRAGHPLAASFRLIAEEIRAPLSTVFAEICQRQTMGVPMEDALRAAALRSASPDLSLFVTSVIIQLRSGGNLADMMDRLACVIRDRKRLAGRVRVLTAQTQLSKRILIAMPIALFFLLNMLNPAYMEPLYSSQDGRMMLIVASVGVLLGAWIMNRMAVIRY